MKNVIQVFDIETGPLPADQLAAIKPAFTANKTLKDPEKIAADLAQKEADWLERAALDATTGMVLAIGATNGLSSSNIWYEKSEAENIADFWAWLEPTLQLNERVAGFCIHRFDLPFLVRRSWILKVSVPWNIRQGRYFNQNLIDLAEVWKMGNYEQNISLDTLSKSLGVGTKNGTGKDFAKLLAEDRDAAIKYLQNDLALTRSCADRLLL
jgi:hypothetical protein